IAVVTLLWSFEPFRVRRAIASAGCLLCLGALTALSFAFPLDREGEFWGHQYVSKFSRSAVVAIVDLVTRGVFEADAAVSGGLDIAGDEPCPAAGKLPHIVMV